jgi:hypothetical protein
MGKDEERERFEAWITRGPARRSIEKSKVAVWSEQYIDYTTQIAWEAWQEALRGEEKGK